MEEYVFVETSSRTVTEDGQRFRRINFRGNDPTNELNVDGYIPKVPEMDYFQAGLDGTLSDLIRNFVIDKLTPTEQSA
ncbi:hypothetical protein SAMN04487943_11523 [Gracilibacillus orientalis]|uniref:Uncharacterized protein n=2 Tax=Gracilibacillus orientalis TaxID=334253 RepID=A0A1I4Q9R1_9BACI|nr:hypothetical protein SAMN04487943_11523 [Gracilibacillus orientalis]